MNGIQLYLRYIAVSIRSQLQYRASFFLQSAGIFLATVVEFLGVWALFDRFGKLRGWSLAEIAFFYGAVNVTFSIADALARGFDQFSVLVKNGDFDRLLVRPRSAILQLMGQEFTIRRVGRFLQGAIVLFWGQHTLHMRWTFESISLFLFAVLGGICLFWGLVILQATSAFWTTEALEVWNAFTYGGVYMSQYPVTIYRSWFREFFTWIIPLSCISYFPFVRLLHHPDPLGTSPLFQWLSPLAGILFLTAALQIWKVGVHRYRSTGS
jgi:ABC-2 type transport system permease protein